MPSQPPSRGTETMRLADAFVRLPNNHQQSGECTAPQKIDSSKNMSAPPQQQQHWPSNSKTLPPLTPQKPSKLSTQASQLFSPHQPHHLPPTPDATPTKKTLKRARHLTAPNNPHNTPSSTKRLRTTAHPTPSPSPHRRCFPRTPKFSILYQPAARRKEKEREGEEEAISWMELKRVAESVLRQVDWDEVAEDVASNRGTGVYKRIVRGVLQERIEELVAGREEGVGE